MSIAADGHRGEIDRRVPKGACNLEWGTVAETDFNHAKAKTVEVIRQSDRISDGTWRVGSTQRSAVGASAIGYMDAKVPFMYYRCQEHDKNGGDCHIVGTAWCL